MILFIKLYPTYSGVTLVTADTFTKYTFSKSKEPKNQMAQFIWEQNLS